MVALRLLVWVARLPGSLRGRLWLRGSALTGRCEKNAHLTS